MGELVSIFLDAVMIGLLTTAIIYALRLSKQLAELRSSRAEMERFVAEFSNTVQRAEAGVRGLKQVSRESGDDLEQLIDKAQMIRDELHFLVGSADKIASRLSDRASAAARTMLPEASARPAPEVKPAAKPAAPTQPAAAKPSAPAPEKKPEAAPTAGSAAERELLKALEKLG